MEFRQIEAYIKVYELKSFSKAADILFVSQPSISAYINALEKELNTQLICRSTKEFIPTKSGKLFYEYAIDIVTHRDRAVFSMKNISEGNLGSIDILASSVPSEYILPEILGDFHKQYPDVIFHLKQADSLEVVKGISQYNSEIGFVGAKIENEKCVYKEFVSEKMIMIAPNEERYQKIDLKNIQEVLYNEYFILRSVGSGTRLSYEETLKRIGVEPEKLKICAYFSSTQSVIQAVANGLGISIVSQVACKQYIQQKMITQINIGDCFERSFYIVQNKNKIQTPIVDTFIKFLHTYRQKYLK